MGSIKIAERKGWNEAKTCLFSSLVFLTNAQDLHVKVVHDHESLVPWSFKQLEEERSLYLYRPSSLRYLHMQCIQERKKG